MYFIRASFLKIRTDERVIEKMMATLKGIGIVELNQFDFSGTLALKPKKM